MPPGVSPSDIPGNSADRYTCEAWVAPGVCVADIERPTFAAIIEAAQTLRDKYDRVALSFGNIDCADVDTNGLTEDETEQLSEAGLI